VAAYSKVVKRVRDLYSKRNKKTTPAISFSFKTSRGKSSKPTNTFRLTKDKTSRYNLRIPVLQGDAAHRCSRHRRAVCAAILTCFIRNLHDVKKIHAVPPPLSAAD
jgi:hypothetical protein